MEPVYSGQELGSVLNVYSHRAGGGKYMAILQCKKTVHTDEGKQRQAALLAFSAFPELKHVILVDEDVDIFDTNDVLWAMNTRGCFRWVTALTLSSQHSWLACPL